MVLHGFTSVLRQKGPEILPTCPSHQPLQAKIPAKEQPKTLNKHENHRKSAMSSRKRPENGRRRRHEEEQAANAMLQRSEVLGELRLHIAEAKAQAVNRSRKHLKAPELGSRTRLQNCL